MHTIKGYGDTAVAEHTVALMFACAAISRAWTATVRAGTWEPLEGMQLTGKTLGIIGLGGIGSEVVRASPSGIGMKVIAWNRTPRADAAVPLVELDKLLARPTWCRSISPSTTRRAGIIDAARIARMKTGAILINTARGALVDEDGA